MIRYIMILSVLMVSYSALASDYAEKAHKAYREKDYPSAGAFYEKAYEQEKTDTYLENASAAYLTHAFNLSNEKEYDQAINYCHKVLSLRPECKNARELLCEIYYSRGTDYYFAGNDGKAFTDLKNSLKYSILPEQRERIMQELSKIADKKLKDWQTNSY